MKLSIIIPAYNAEKYIKRCIESVLFPYKSYEIIIINDGSYDSTEKIIKNLKSDKIKYYRNENHGVSYSRNYGIKKAKGEYIMFLDSDDYLLENWKEEIMAILDNKNKYDIAIFGKNLNLKYNKKEDLIEYIVGMKKPLIASVYSKLYLRRFIIDNKIEFNENIMTGEDMLFNIECILKSQKILIENKSFYMYRYVLGSLTNSYNEKYLLSNEVFLKTLEKMLEKKDDIENVEILNFCKSNSIVELVERLSYFKSFKSFKRIIIKEKKYCKFSKYQSLKSKIIICLLKIKFYLIVFIIYRIKHLITKYKNYNSEIFIKI